MSENSKRWIALLPAMVVPCLASLFYFVFFSQYLFAKAIYAGTKIFTLVWPAICVFLVFKTGFRRFDHPGIIKPRIIMSGFVTGFLIVISMLFLMKTPMGEVVAAGGSHIHAKAVQLGFLKHYWSFTLFLSLAHSLIEEYYWRWFVYGFLRRELSIVPSLLLAGTSFAAHHIVVLSQYFPMTWAWVFGGAIGLGGILWCLMFERQKTVLGAWISHAIVDLGIMTLGYEVLLKTGSA